MPAFKSDPYFLINVAGLNINTAADPRVVSMEFGEGDDEGKYFKFKMTDFLMKFMDDPRFVEGTKVTWRYGYVNNLSPLFTANIGEVECAFDRDDGNSITVTTFDAVMEALSKTRSYAWKAPTGDGWYFSDVVKKIAAEYGLTPVVEPTKHKWATFQQNETDWEFIQRHSNAKPLDASKEGTYRLSFSADNKKLIWKPVPINGPQVKTYVYYTETINPEVISFRPRSKPHDPKAKGKAGTTNAETGPNDDAVEEEQGNETDAERNVSEGGYYVDTSKPSETGRYTGAVTQEPAVETGNRRNDPVEVANQAAKGRFRKDELAAIEADMEVILEPNLRRGDTIMLRGFGKKFSGKWLITGLRAIIDSNGARNELELVKTTIADAAMANKPSTGKPSGPGNPEGNQPIQEATVDTNSGSGQ